MPETSWASQDGSAASQGTSTAYKGHIIHPQAPKHINIKLVKWVSESAGIKLFFLRPESHVSVIRLKVSAREQLFKGARVGL